MPRFKRLTAAEARTLTRHQLLDRIESEQQYWERKKTRSSADDEAAREFRRIMYACLNPAEALDDALAYLNGQRVGPSYWDQRPSIPDREELVGGQANS